MPYTKQPWADGPEGGTPLVAARLNYMDDGIAGAYATAEAATAASVGAAPAVHTHVSTDLTDSTTLGRALLKAADAASARALTGAGTSNLTIGLTSTSAAAGDHTHTSAALTDATATGVSLLTAASQAAARTAIGAGTGSSNLAIGTTSSTAKAGNYAPTLVDIPASLMGFVVQNGDGSWPNRPTSRTDLKVMWIKIVTGSADPAIVTSPAVNGGYVYDPLVGV